LVLAALALARILGVRAMVVVVVLLLLLARLRWLVEAALALEIRTILRAFTTVATELKQLRQLLDRLSLTATTVALSSIPLALAVTLAERVALSSRTGFSNDRFYSWHLRRCSH
jgi:hypothetical protein